MKKFLFFGTVDEKGNFEKGIGSDSFGYLDNRKSLYNQELDGKKLLESKKKFNSEWNGFAICTGTILNERIVKIVKVY